MISRRLASRVFVCDKNFNVVIFLDVIKMIKVKLRMMVTTHSALPVHTTFSNLDCISKSQQYETVLTSYNFTFLSS